MGKGLRPVMVDHGNKIQPPAQQDRKVRAATILKFNSTERVQQSESKQEPPFWWRFGNKKEPGEEK